MNIENLCTSLKENKKDIEEEFTKLNKGMRILFLSICGFILEKRSYDLSFLLSFRLYKALQKNKNYSSFINKHENAYKHAVLWNSKGLKHIDDKPISYDKKYQKSDGNVPWKIFYLSLYDENNSSALAITWLTEHGLLEGKERELIERKYERLVKEKQLIK